MGEKSDVIGSDRRGVERRMIWIGTSGWVYPHWVDRFYPHDLPTQRYLPYYAQHFPTVEINNSFYRLPTREQFQGWSEQTASHPSFLFAVKASRYLTHMKKLLNAEEGIERLVTAAMGLDEHLGPFLYQLPPHWQANLARLEQFIAHFPSQHRAAFEFRDPTWFQPTIFLTLCDLLETAGCTVAVAVGGSLPTPLDLPAIGPIGYVRFHHGAHGIGLSDDELDFWARRLSAQASGGREMFVYFNNDAEGYAVRDALRLRELLGSLAMPVT
jgi:uncharacterized protein YecE (DUF72 family)